MKDDELIGAIGARGPILEKACVKACKQMRDGGNWSDFELREGYREIWRLNQGRDLAYDRPSIGLHYALWYHLQRTHYLIRAMTPLLRDRQNRMAIYDAGCGTGASAWAAATVTAGLADAGHKMPQVDVFGKDTSPFMLEAAESLWSRLTDSMPSDVRVYNSLGSWTEPPSDIEKYDDILIVCSFLLNSSDNRYLKELSRRLSQVHREIGARQLLLVSPRSKQYLATTLSSSARWEAVPLKPLGDLWDGEIKQLNSLRKALLSSVGQHSPYPPSWSVTARPKFLLLERHAETLTDAANHILDKKQEKAAEPEDRLTYVVGAAGSGKSLVLCERVGRICERALASEPPHILVTTFNKPMLEQLIIWTKLRISASTQNLTLIGIGGDSSNGDYQLSVSNARQVDCKITFLNRDKLPTRVWQMLPSNIPVVEIDGLKADAFDELTNELFDVDFIDKELELVVLGMDAWVYERYVDPAITARHGRRQGLTRRQRAELWPKLVARANVTTWPEVCLYRRLSAQRYYESTLASGKQVRLRDSISPITHLLVDEGQDMTRSELRLLARTPTKAQRLFVTGDTTQAIHTAGISPRPRIEGAQWEVLTLAGSYRLPALVCEALQPLAKKILAKQSEASGSIPEVRRSAVPGPRPIIVDASRDQDMATALIAMSSFESANLLNRPDWSVICEPPGKQHRLAMTLEKYDIGVQCESMLRIKGLERPLVIFPTDAVPPYDEASEEWIYTALTRSRCVLVIALLPDTPPAVTNALCRLNQGDEHLMFWDESARAAWADMCRGSAS